MPKDHKFIIWAPRIISVLFALFLVIFSFDVITPQATFWQIILGLFMHNIPVFILAAVIWISWYHELVGATAFTIVGIFFIIFTFIRMAPDWLWVLVNSLILSIPAFLVAFLYYLSWRKKKQII